MQEFGPIRVVPSPFEEADMKVLIIEDRPEDAVIIRKQLESEAPSGDPIQITHALDLASGIEHLHDDEFDCALLDLNLPDGRGLNNLRRLHHVAPKLPVVVLSGIEDERTAANAVKTGAFAYIVKRPLGQGEELYPVLQDAASSADDNAHTNLETINPRGRFKLDPQFKLVDWDEHCVALLHWTSEQMQGRSLLDLAPDNRRDELVQSLRHARDDISPIKIPLLLPDGKYRRVEIHPRSLRDSGSEWGLTDAEESRRAHQAMQVLDLILGATRDAVFSQDLDGQIHNCSYSIADFVGVPATDIIGKNFTELFPSSERASAQFILSAIRRGRIVRDLNTEFEHANTAKVPVIITIAPLRDELGGLIGACILAKPRAEGGEDQNWRRERLMLEERYLNLQEELSDLRQELRTMRPTGND